MVMKEDLAGGPLPSGKFGQNAAWWWIMVLALNLDAVMSFDQIAWAGVGAFLSADHSVGERASFLWIACGCESQDQRAGLGAIRVEARGTGKLRSFSDGGRGASSKGAIWGLRGNRGGPLTRPPVPRNPNSPPDPLTPLPLQGRRWIWKQVCGCGRQGGFSVRTTWRCSLGLGWTT